MTLFEKLKEAISANLDNAIDKRTNPSIMADYYVKKAEEELDETRKNTASVMADRLATERALADAESKVASMTECAERAMQAGNKEDARAALEKKAQFVDRVERLKQKLEIDTQKEKQMSDLYEAQLRELEQIREDASTIKANVAIADAQNKINDYSVGSTETARSKFKKAKDKSTRLVDEATCVASISQKNVSADSLINKYGKKSSSIDDELAALEKKYATN